jgi:hypothetical protein
MGSTMYVKLRSNMIKKNAFVPLTITVHDKKKDPVTLTGREVEFVVHFESGSDNFASIASEWGESDKKDPPGYYTITCVSDFMWFLLSLRYYYSDSIVIEDCRPNPFNMIPVQYDSEFS